MTPKLKKIIIAIVFLGIIFLLYAIFLRPDPNNESLVAGRGDVVGRSINQDSKVVSSQITQALLKIEQIKLERSIFDNKVLLSLKDKSQEIEDEPIGRSNPFAPLADTSVNVNVRNNLNMSSSTKATSTKTQTASTTLAN